MGRLGQGLGSELVDPGAGCAQVGICAVLGLHSSWHQVIEVWLLRSLYYRKEERQSAVGTRIESRTLAWDQSSKAHRALRGLMSVKFS